MVQNIEITLASEVHRAYIPEIEQAIYQASLQKGTGIAVRSTEYLLDKIMEGKAVIALGNESLWAGFCYIESWGHNKFVANSGLIVSSAFRGAGLASEIKKRALELSAQLFPGAQLFGLTTSLAVMKINSGLGYQPVTFSELTDDDEFWKGCETCPYYDILVRTKRDDCLCTAMVMDPKKKNKVNGEAAASGIKVKINHIENPRREAEEHYYNPTYQGLIEIGVEPHYLTKEIIAEMFKVVERYKDNIREDVIFKGVKW